MKTSFTNQWSRYSLAVPAVLVLIFGVELFQWTFNRVYVPQGNSLVLRYKGPPLPFLPGNRPVAEPGQFAKVDENGRPLEIGILKEMRGPGRHFIWIGWWETKLIPDVTVKPGQVAVVSSKMGADLKNGQFLVDGDLDETTQKGILRKVFGPGTYRINDYAYNVKVIEEETIKSGLQVKHAGWVSIPTGYVGVVTNLTDNPITKAVPGIQDNILQPGLYPVNPNEQHVDIVGIGYTEKSLKSNLKSLDGHPILDDSGEPAVMDDESGISFPSNDGFRIHMDFTAVWGIMPDQAADVIRKFGTLDAVETKVVVPQIESICRNQGSSLGAVDLLVGETRRKFQEDVSGAFKEILLDKGLTLLHGFVRNIHIPLDVRKPIQEKFVADELKLTRDQELLTAGTEANLREAEKKVELEEERIKAETKKLVAEAAAEGEKEAEETKAETLQKTAVIARQTAELDAESTVTLGKAKAGAKQLEAEAKSELFTLAVSAFGSGSAYNEWVFATGLPKDVQLDLLYAGEGTFWTDLKGFTEVMVGRQAGEQQKTTKGK
ncbi:MAG: SPFH domain-containing protein [Planctomycetota bacterium]|nr:MAG: SPFH domain-containing protein [Planctomycetota bacterium]